MNKKERVQEVLSARPPDRPPVSFWHHFPSGHTSGQPAIDAHMRHFETYDLDFLKIMNDNGYPWPKSPITAARDLSGLQASDGDEGPFALQLDLIRGLRRRLGADVLCCTTVFNAWATLRNLTVPPLDKHGPPVIEAGSDPRDRVMQSLLKSKSALAEALEKIGRTLAAFAAKCIEAGADGIYLSCRDDWVDGPDGEPGAYDDLVKPHDLEILKAADKGTFNVLHVCGKAIDFQRFSRYPTQVLSWADRACGPTITFARDLVRGAMCCGVDNLATMPKGTPQQCADEVRDALDQAAGRAIIIAPGCTYDPEAVPKENLLAIRRAVEA